MASDTFIVVLDTYGEMLDKFCLVLLAAGFILFSRIMIKLRKRD